VAVVSHREFLNKLETGDLPPVVLFAPGKAPFNGEPFEPLLVDRALEATTARIVEPGMEDMAYVSFYADETRPEAIASEAETLPFLAAKRVIVVRNADRYAALAGTKGTTLYPLIEYLKRPNEATVLLLIASKVDKRRAFYKACNQVGLVVECPQLAERELGPWVTEEAHTLGKKLRRDAIDELVHRAGTRLSDIANALRQVAQYVGGQSAITVEDVVAACSEVAEESVWALTDAIAKSDPKAALHSLEQLCDLNKSPDEIMGLINWLLDSAYRAHPETEATLSSNFVGQKVLPLAQKFGKKKLGAAMALATKTHFMLRSTGVDSRMALELLVIKLAVPRKRRRAA